MSRLVRILLLFVALLSLRSLSFAWGCSGHEIVALIAERQLNPAAAAAIQSLLGDTNLYDKQVFDKIDRFCKQMTLSPGEQAASRLIAFYATWADDFRSSPSGNQTAPFHFWDVPLIDRSQPDGSRFCDQGCVTKAIQDQITVLKSGAAKPQKTMALALLIHFVGDLHQPLHAIDNNDRGANCVPVTFFGRTPTLNKDSGNSSPNLHSVWDTDLLERIAGIRRQTHEDDVTQFVNTLMSNFEDELPEWNQQDVDVVEWAIESHHLAVIDSYGRLPRRIKPERPVAVQKCTDDNNISQRMLALHERINQNYQNAVAPVIEEQLAKAGTRLAVILNQIFPQG